MAPLPFDEWCTEQGTVAWAEESIGVARPTSEEAASLLIKRYDCAYEMLWFRACILSVAALMTSCSTQHYFVNLPLPDKGATSAYSLRNMEPGPNTDSLDIVVTMSGGGYRAAALAYAVLEVMNETQISWEGRQKTLLSEVDIISGVSGGSLTAAYFVANRDHFFKRFERDVLEVDLQSKVVQRILSPRGLWSTTSSHFGRGDVLQDVLDDEFFHGVTFGELPRVRPMVYVNATEIHFGQRFEFTQDSFDHLCSDLSTFPVSRAVAASMAVPVAFSPVTVWNHSAACARNVAKPLPAPAIDDSRFLHLVDGGLADNIGVRMPLEMVAGHGGLLEATRQGGIRGVKKGVFIVINAHPSPDMEDDDSPETPSLLRQFRAAFGVPISRSSVDGIGLLRAAVERWTTQVRDAAPNRLGDVLDKNLAFHVVEVNLEDVPNTEEFRAIRKMPTTLRITPEQLSAMKRYARFSLQRDPAWRALLEDLSPSK